MQDILMSLSIEQKIKDFVRSQGVDVVGLAGPDRLDGPPSLDPTYTMKEARSIISMALPMASNPIHDYLGKKSPVPHSIDQFKENQRIFRISEMVAGYIRSLGYKAAVVPPNSSYRRNLYIYALQPSFSHRFGAIAAGIAGQGWSGNVLTEEYGGAMYLDTIVTDAVFKSDPQKYGPRHFIDNWCAKCKLCDKVCTLGMFKEKDEEYILINGELHPRGKRRDINLCSGACFGLHAISRDKKFSTWGYHWDKAWMNTPSDNFKKWKVVLELTMRSMWTGDSGARYKMIQALGMTLQKEEVLNEYLDKHPETLSHEEHVKAFKQLAEGWGITGIQDDVLLTCANCCLICGPTLEETADRYKAITTSGLMVPVAGGKLVNVPTYEEAVKIRQLPRRSTWLKFKDALAMAYVFHKWYFGFEPKSFINGRLYQRRLKKAVADRVKGYKNTAETVGNI